MTAPLWDQRYSAHDNQVHNEVGGNASVGQMNGVNHGNTTVHHGAQIYTLPEGAFPEDRYRIALNHLRADISRTAEEMLWKLIRDGYGSSECAYYYALAILSQRSPSVIAADQLDALDQAYKAGMSYSNDPWQDALDWINRFVGHVMQHDFQQAAGSEQVQQFHDALNQLNSDRRREIMQHLGSLLDGATQDALENDYEQHIVEERMRPDRQNRAWKFFHADPTPPEPHPIAPYETTGSSWSLVWGGGILLLIGLLSLISTLSSPARLAALPILAVGGYLTIVQGVTRHQLAKRLARKEFEHHTPPPEYAPGSPGNWVPARFARQIHERVEDAFHKARPHTAGSGYWEPYTRGLRTTLKRKLIHLYGNTSKPATAESVDYLIRWHARRTADVWCAGALFNYRAELQPKSRTTLLFRLGVALLVLGLLGFFSGFSVLCGGLGMYLGIKGYLDIGGARRALQQEEAEVEQLLALEQEEYQRWSDILSDRPDDTEMARWLRLDREYVKRAVRKRLGLSNRDLVAAPMITEGVQGAWRARVPNGPVRYSRYTVRIFLLTRSGFRSVEVNLDFLDGSFGNEQRNSFRYDALASARVSETGQRWVNEQYYNQPFGPEREPREFEVLQSREFCLTLVSGETINVTVEDFRGMTEDTDDQEQLHRIALDSSGIAGALRVFEMVAAEGRDWIVQEQKRRERSSQHRNENGM